MTEQSSIDALCSLSYAIAIHEAGHAVAAIRAGWPFSHIQMEPFTGGEFRFGRTPWAYGWDESFCQPLIVHSLAGAVAQRKLIEPLVTDEIYFPSPEDVKVLEHFGYYPPGTGELVQHVCNALHQDDPSHSKAVAAVEAIFAPDMPMVEAFVIENQQAIGAVAIELLNMEAGQPLGYETIRTVVENADKAREAAL